MFSGLIEHRVQTYKDYGRIVTKARQFRGFRKSLTVMYSRNMKRRRRKLGNRRNNITEDLFQRQDSLEAWKKSLTLMNSRRKREIKLEKSLTLKHEEKDGEEEENWEAEGTKSWRILPSRTEKGLGSSCEKLYRQTMTESIPRGSSCLRTFSCRQCEV